MHGYDVFHLYGKHTIDASDEAFGILNKVLDVFGQCLLKHGQLTVIHSLNQKPSIKREKEEGP